MAEHILRFLRYGAPSDRIAALGGSATRPFLPSLVLSAVDSPALMPNLLPSLIFHPQIPRALAYAGLNYTEIVQSVLETEAEIVRSTDSEAEVQQQEDDLGEEEELRRESQWKWEVDDDTDVVDECHAFEVADEKERVRLAMLSLRRRAREFSVRALESGASGKEAPYQLEKDEGSMWSNEACLPELLCLLPIAVARCPALLPPELLVRGLLSASSGCFLLVATFTNNPVMVERGALELASMLVRQSEVLENHPGSPHASEASSAAVRPPGISSSGPVSREHSGAPSHEVGPHCAEVMMSVLVSLCQVAPSLAAICREALVKTCTLADMALHITVEIFHDELQFLSKLIFFPKERTSRWILAFIGANQKHGDNQHVLVPLTLPDEKEKEDGKGNPLVTNAKGVAMRVRESLLADARSVWRKQGWCGNLHAHLRLYCLLIRAGDLQPTHEEIDFWIRALGGTFDHSSAGESGQSVKTSMFVSERTLQLGICFVCLVPGLSSPSTKNLLHACIANLLRPAMGNTPVSFCAPEIELAVWVAVQLLLRQFADIAGLVRKALGMHVTVHTASMRDLADAAGVAGVLSDPFVAASAAAALRPRGPIPSTKKQQWLGLKCLEQLLSTGTFARCAVDISDTVMHYICIAAEPIHPALPSIVQGYADLSPPAGPRARANLQRFRMRPFSRASLVKAMAPGLAILRSSLLDTKTLQMARLSGSMKLTSSSTLRDLGRTVATDKNGDGDPLATTALVTYYILYREQMAGHLGTSGGANHDNTNSLVDDGEDGWWLDLLGDLPWRELLMYMEVNWPAYEHLLPQWLCLASVVFPQKFTAQALLQDLEKTDTSFQTHVKGVLVTHDLDWVGPLQKFEAELVVSAPSRIDSPTCIPQRNEPEVVSPVGSPVRKYPSQERSLPSPMDVDKEAPHEPVLHPVEGETQKIESQSSAMDVGEAKSMVSADLLGLDTVSAAMSKAIQNPLPALRILNAMMTSSRLGMGNNVTGNLEAIAGFGVDWSLEAAVMKELVPHLLDSSCPRCLHDQFCVWWRSVPSSTLEYLVPVLWDLIKDPLASIGGDPFRISGGQQNVQFKQSRKRIGPTTVTLSTSGLAEEPLKLLACNMKVFRSPILSIILDLLQELLAANRRIGDLATMDVTRDATIKREEVSGAMVAQDSAVCQILLEACLSNAELGDDRRPGPLLEARSLICATICSLLHRSPLLLKLLHFQGYDVRLIPMMVEGVPATVQCLDFIGDLLQQSQQQRQVFAAALTAHLITSHPDLPQSLVAAQQVVGQVTQMRTKVAGCAGYLQEVLGSVAQCASTFPSLAPQVVALLQNCAQAGGPLVRSGPLRDPALHAAAVAAFKYLVQGKLLHGRPLLAM